MAHVVLQSAEFRSVESAARCEAELRALFDAYVKFEKTDPNPWGQERAVAPLVAFGQRHGVVWPDGKEARFALKGPFEDAAELLRVDRMVFFWGGGFDLGGPTLQQVLVRLGATAVAQWCRLRIRSDDPERRLAELAAFLDDEDYEDQYAVTDDPDEIDAALFVLEVQGPSGSRRLVFDDSGVQDWAFVAVLPQLDGEDPRLAQSDLRTPR
jgi:hypothetical protein